MIVVYGTENASLTHELLETAQDDTELPIMFDFPITRNLHNLYLFTWKTLLLMFTDFFFLDILLHFNCNFV